MNFLHLGFDVVWIASALWLSFFSFNAFERGRRENLGGPWILGVMLISTYGFLLMAFLHVIFDATGVNILGASAFSTDTMSLATHLTPIIVFSLGYFEYRRLLRRQGALD